MPSGKVWRYSPLEIARAVRRLVGFLAGFRAGQLLRIFVLCQITGALGVASGFAVFFLFIEEGHNPGKFLIALLVAAVLSLTFETLREIIDHAEHWSFSKIPATMSALAIAEFFVMAGDKSVEVFSDHEAFAATTRAVAPGTSTNAEYSGWDLGFLAGLWLFVGTILAGWLSSGISHPKGKLSRQVRVRACYGAIAGAVIAPLALVVYVIIVNVAHGIYIMLSVSEALEHNTRQLGTYMSNHMGTFLLIIFVLGMGTSFKILFAVSPLIRKLQSAPRVLGLPVVIGLSLVILCLGMLISSLAVSLFMYFVGGIVAPLMPHLDKCLLMAGRAALIWLIPGLVLGGLTPLLNRPSGSLPAWGGMALLASVILVIITLLRFADRWWVLVLILPLSLLIIPIKSITWRGNVSSHVGKRLEAHWPAMALTVGTLACAAMMVFHHVASFTGVYQQFHVLSHLPDELPRIRDHRHEKIAQEAIAVGLREMAKVDKMIHESLGPLSLSDYWLKAQDTDAKLRKMKEEFDEAGLGQPIANSTWWNRDAEIREAVTEMRQKRFHAQVELLDEFQKEVSDENEVTHIRLARVEDLVRSAEKISVEIPPDSAPTYPKVNRVIPAELQAGDVRQAMLDKIRALNAENLQNRSELLAVLSEHKKVLLERNAQLQRLRDEVLDPKEREPARWFEVAMAASFGFWTTVGMLAGWSQFNHHAVETTPS